MPRKKWIDKKNATTYQLVHRPQNDPLINDESLPDRILHQVSGPSTDTFALPQSKGLHIADLEEELDFESVRENEGEAANYGIYYDDTNYDYMQHLREFGEGSGESHFVDAAPITFKGKGKGKAKIMKLEDALRRASLQDEEEDEIYSPINGTRLTDTDSSSELPAREIIPPNQVRNRTYQDQQDVPDVIAGFQPDMNPRLREALEALEDEAYVDDKDEEDLFASLVDGGQAVEVDPHEFNISYEDDEGWESDVTEKPSKDNSGITLDATITLPASQPTVEDLPFGDGSKASEEDGDWMKEFAKSKNASKTTGQKAALARSAVAPSDIQTSRTSLYTAGGTPLRKKRRKGALTNPSAYSMTSASLARTEGQQLLDDRFDRLEAIYDEDENEDFDDDEDGGMSIATGASNMSKMSKMSTTSTSSFKDGPLRSDLDSMMDEFLGGWNQGQPGGRKRQGAKGKRGKNGNEVIGIRMLDEVRQELGPARLAKAQKT